jgi:hypothetical protein
MEALVMCFLEPGYDKSQGGQQVVILTEAASE